MREFVIRSRDLCGGRLGLMTPYLNKPVDDIIEVEEG